VPKLAQRVFRLRFPDDPEMDALNIVSRSVTLGTLMDTTDLGVQAADLDVSDPAQVKAALVTASGVTGLFEHFAAALVSWGLTEDDPDNEGEERPVPATLDGIRSQDAGHMLSIINVWMDAILGRLSVPLSNGSNGGGPSGRPSIPMEAPSTARSN
jgi:hypothetical protein